MNDIAEYIQALIGSERFHDQVAAHFYHLGRPQQASPVDGCLPQPIAAMLRQLDIEQLYSHQSQALTAICRGEHTVVATPTASGKTLIYNLPFFKAWHSDPETRALYLFPLKALAQDQLATFMRWAERVGSPKPSAAIYDGDTNAYQRKKIRLRLPHVIMSNPEMLHLALLPYHDRWQQFFMHLKLVVIDEVHTYRGMLGAHMAQIIRRLRRICHHYGASPAFIFTSATVANPDQLASRLSGLPVRLVQKSGAPQGGRHIVLIDPLKGAARAAILLLKAALPRGLRTIVYTQSRKLAELIAIWAQQSSGKWHEKISVYRAGLMPHDRRAVEQRLKNGDLLAVVTTSALELGIDIGDLDMCILVGYPGSMISTLQRSGRVGRQGQEAALILIAAENALDKYFMSHPDAFQHGRPEKAVLNPHNVIAVQAHLECAAAELPLSSNEEWLGDGPVGEIALALEAQGVLRRTADGGQVYARRKRPHADVSLRGLGNRHRIVDSGSDTTIGEIDAHRLYRDTHPGAIYLHQGRTYLVETIDPVQRCVRVRAVQADYTTRVIAQTEVEILEVYESRWLGRGTVCIGTLKITDTITAFDQVLNASGRPLQRIALNAPPSVFETQGIWFDVPAEVCRTVSLQDFDVMGALHAAEHAAISLVPLLILVDRNDLGGLSTPFHAQIGSAAIFIYDGVPGGAGFSSEAFERAGELLTQTQEAIRICPCEKGCPSCVHSPKCGSGNHPIDKDGALALLTQLRQPASAAIQAQRPAVALKRATINKPFSERRPRLYGVFDLETQCSAQEVGGWHQAHLMRISCGVVYDSDENDCVVYAEDQVEALIAHLQRLDLVIGFNVQRFDYKVLSGYSKFDFGRLPTLDLLQAAYQQLGFRLSLDHLAQATLGVGKAGSGLDALRWWQEGCLDKIVAYCRMDVCITRDLYRFARDKGYLLYQESSGQKFRVPIPTCITQHTRVNR